MSDFQVSRVNTADELQDKLNALAADDRVIVQILTLGGLILVVSAVEAV